MSDEHLAEYNHTHGNSILFTPFAMGQYRESEDTSIQSPRIRKRAVRERLQDNHKQKTSPKQAKSSRSKKLPHKMNAQKNDLSIRLGWFHKIGDKWLTVVEASKRSGTHHLKIPCDRKMKYLKQRAIGLFFPQGQSEIGAVSDFHFKMCDSNKNEIDNESTVGELYDENQGKMLKVYLATCPKALTETNDPGTLTPVLNPPLMNTQFLKGVTAFDSTTSFENSETQPENHDSQEQAEISDRMKSINSSQHAEDITENSNDFLPHETKKIKEALFKAAEMNETEELSDLIKDIKAKKMDMSSFYREGNETPLHHAAKFSNHSVMEILVTEYPDMVHEQRDKDSPCTGLTALHIAVAIRDLFAVKLLLSHVPETSDQSSVPEKNKQTLLHATAKAGDFVGTCMEGELVLAIAAWNTDLEMVRELLKQGALPFKRDSKERTVFHSLIHLASMEEQKNPVSFSEYPQTARLTSHKSNILNETSLLASSLGKTIKKMFEVKSRISKSLNEDSPVTDILDVIKEGMEELNDDTARKTLVITKNLSVLASLEQISARSETDNCERIKETFQELLNKTDVLDTPLPFALDLMTKRAYIQFHLLSLRDAKGLTPLTLAAKLGVHVIFDLIINMEHTYKFLDDTDGVSDIYLYDVTDIDSAVRFNDRTSALERIPFDKPEEAFVFVEMSPIREMVSAKWKEYKKYLFLWGIFHVLAMVGITTCCCLRPSYREAQPISNLNVSNFSVQASTSILEQMYSQPEQKWRAAFEIFFAISCLFILTFEVIYELLIHKHLDNIILGNGTYKITYIIFTFCGVLTSVARLFAYQFEEIPMVFMLVFGWYFSLFFLRGFKKFSFFTVMIQKVIYGDLFRFLVAFFTFLVGFSSAMFVSFQDAPERIPEEFANYLSAMFTLLKLALGLADIEVLDQASKPWLAVFLFLLFVVLAYVLLLNMLIALLSETCSVVAKNKIAQWKLQRLSLILLIERRLPKCWRKLCGSIKNSEVSKKTPSNLSTDVFANNSAIRRRSLGPGKRLFQKVKAASYSAPNSYVTGLNRITTNWLNRSPSRNRLTAENNTPEDDNYGPLGNGHAANLPSPEDCFKNNPTLFANPTAFENDILCVDEEKGGERKGKETYTRLGEHRKKKRSSGNKEAKKAKTPSPPHKAKHLELRTQLVSTPEYKSSSASYQVLQPHS